jgi:CheY-like chemotaxis protein
MKHPDLKSEHGKILIAEDDLINRRLIFYQLKDFQDDLLFARDGNEVVNIFKENDNVCLILMDLQMPGMNGVEAAKKILEFEPEARVIGLSAYPKEACRFDAESVDFVDYVSKPIKKSELIKVISKHLA